MNKKELEQKIGRLEKLLLPEVEKISSDVEWVKEEGKLEWNRKINGLSIDNYFDEECCKIYIETSVKNGKKIKGWACKMDRGIILFSKYIPIYKDIIRKMEKIQKEFHKGL